MTATEKPPFTASERRVIGKLFIWWIGRIDWTKAIERSLPLRRKRR